MSRICGINIEIDAPCHKQIDLLQLLLDHGWQPGFDNQIMFLPFGDGESYDWQSAPREAWHDVFNIMKEKAEAGEQLGLDLTWEDSNLGGTFHFATNEINTRIWTIWYANRPQLVGCEWLTDHGWFLERIIPPILKAGIQISSLRSSDVY